MVLSSAAVFTVPVAERFQNPESRPGRSTSDSSVVYRRIPTEISNLPSIENYGNYDIINFNMIL